VETTSTLLRIVSEPDLNLEYCAPDCHHRFRLAYNINSMTRRHLESIKK